MSNPTPSLPPGFRFHPTDEELILHYLRNRAASSPCPVSIIAEVDIYKFDPWDLPDKAMFGDREWYFFSPRDRKYPNGVRPNRAAASGYWKATGTDKPVVATKGNENIGVKKALVFYKGKPPKGHKTNWIMHEYRLSEAQKKSNCKPMKLRDSSMRLDDWVLCRIYQKSNHLHEDSVGDEAHLPFLPNSTQQNNLKLHKSFSLTNLFDDSDCSLLSSLFETPTDRPVLEQSSFGYTSLNHPFIDKNSGKNYILNQLSETESSVSVTDSSLKRQRVVEEGGSLLHPSKKNTTSSWVFTNFANQFDSQPFFNQQLLFNSHLGLQ